MKSLKLSEGWESDGILPAPATLVCHLLSHPHHSIIHEPEREENHPKPPRAAWNSLQGCGGESLNASGRGGAPGAGMAAPGLTKFLPIPKDFLEKAHSGMHMVENKKD